MEKLDLENVRVYSGTKDDIVVGIKHIESEHFLGRAEGDGTTSKHSYFVLAEDAKIKEYKPFTDSEQLIKEGLGIGNSFWVRSKDNTEFVHLVTVSEITLNSEGRIASIGLGTSVFSPKELLKHYEWSKSPKENDWRPFGISLEF